METTTNQAVNKRPYISAIVVLLIMNVASFYLLFNEKGTNKDLGAEKTALQQDFDMLTDTLTLRSTEMEQLIGKNAEMDAIIAQGKEEISLQKKQIQNLLQKVKLSKSELAKLKGMIEEYKNSITAMTGQLAELTKQNEELTARNSQLNTDLAGERENSTRLTAQNQYLGQKVEIGSLLPVAKIEVDAVKTRNNGKEVAVNRAKAAANLRITFETGTNRVIEPGPVDLYVRIINPKGETIMVEDQGSGIIQAPVLPEPLAYTKKAEIDYQQANKKVTVYWGKNIQEPGIYKVELYQGGHVIGQGQVKLS